MESIATSMLSISTFPCNREEDIPIRKFIPRGIMTMTYLILDMHDEVQQSTTSGSSTTDHRHESDLQMTGVESMMRRLL